MDSILTPMAYCIQPGRATSMNQKLVLIANPRTYRDYVNDTGQNVAVEAGPNGPENVSLLIFINNQFLDIDLYRTMIWTTHSVATWA